MTVTAIKNIPGLHVKTLTDNGENLQRLGTLNDSYRKRYATYTKLAAMVVLFLVGFIVIQMAEPMISSMVSNILMVGLVLFVGYYIAIYFSELGSRSTLNYDELNISTENPGSQSTPVNLGSNTGELLPDGGSCKDDSCCAPGTRYSSTLKQCITDCSKATGNVPVYQKDTGACVASGTGTNFILAAESFTLGSSQFQTSGEQYVDRARMSLPMSAVGGAYTGGLTPSNEGIEKYSYV